MQIAAHPLAFHFVGFVSNSQGKHIRTSQHCIDGNLPPVKLAVPASLDLPEIEPVTFPVDSDVVGHYIAVAPPFSRLLRQGGEIMRWTFSPALAQITATPPAAPRFSSWKPPAPCSKRRSGPPFLPPPPPPVPSPQTFPPQLPRPPSSVRLPVQSAHLSASADDPEILYRSSPFEIPDCSGCAGTAKCWS